MAPVTDTEPQIPAAPTEPAELGRTWSTYQPWLQRDPVPYWEALREGAAVVRSDELGGYWILTRYEDIEWAARHPEIFSNGEIGLPHRQIYTDKLIPIQLDGDDHRLWRQTLTGLFSPGVVNHVAPQIRLAAAEAVRPIAERGRCEFIGEFAVKLPAETFLINFGIGREHLGALLDHRDWLRREGLPKAKSDEELHQAGRPMWEFFSAAVDRRRGEPVDGARDVISQLIAMRHEGRELTQAEIVNIILMTMFASLDTTNSMLGLIFLHLAEHTETRRIVIEQPERIPSVVEELIRHAAMVSTARVVLQDVELRGARLHEGDRVLMSWGLSGLDPAVFDQPGEVDFERSSTRHLAFGVGPHRCLGMHLARRIIRTALEEWHARIPDYHVAEGTVPVRRYSPIRGLDSLKLTVGEG